MERAQPPGGGEGELAGAFARQPARPELEAVTEEIAPEPRDDAFGRPVGREVADRGDHAPSHQGQGGQGDRGCHVAQRYMLEQRPIDGAGDGDGLDDDGDRAQDGDAEGHAGGPAQSGNPPGQLGIDQTGARRGRAGPGLRG